MSRTIEDASTRLPTRVVLPPGARAPSAARSAVAVLARGLPSTLEQRLVLTASELVTNALRHAVAVNPTPSMTIDVTPERIVLAVHDPGTHFDLDAPRGQPGPGGGWGLRLVDSLADRWWIERDHGTRVVCEFDRGQRPQRRPAVS
jgi:anti-sigma regulatory factor (Ser/Thr protein kinase)